MKYDINNLNQLINKNDTIDVDYIIDNNVSIEDRYEFLSILRKWGYNMVTKKFNDDSKIFADNDNVYSLQDIIDLSK